MQLYNDTQKSDTLISDKIEFLVSKYAQCSETGPVTIKDMQTPPPSLLISLLWMMGSVLHNMVKIIK